MSQSNSEKIREYDLELLREWMGDEWDGLDEKPERLVILRLLQEVADLKAELEELREAK